MQKIAQGKINFIGKEMQVVYIAVQSVFGGRFTHPLTYALISEITELHSIVHASTPEFVAIPK